jgi:hypothetical protein
MTTQPGSNNLGISGKSLYAGRKLNTGADSVPVSDKSALKSYKYALTRHAGRLLYNPDLSAAQQHRTCWCHRGVANAADSVTVYRQISGESARLHGVTTCKSVWACPVCSAKICATRQAEVSEAMKAHIAAGGYVFLMTQTFPHEVGMPLGELIERQTKARLLFRNSRAYRRGKAARTGYICSLEITAGEAHGWHPHTHELVFATPEAFGETTEGEGGRLASRLIDELKEAWYMALRKAGLCEQSQMSDVLAHGLDIRGGQYAADYMLKFGRDQKWGLSRELTMHAAKVGSDNKGAHPFQLLAWSEQGDARAALQFREYVSAMEGKRMLSWSKGLKKALLNEEDISDEEAADKELPEELAVARIDSEALSVLHSRRLLAHFIAYVADYCGDPDSAQSEVDTYIEWARTVDRTARGEVKVKMWCRGFRHTDAEVEHA